tara:strand:+ start:110 stop:358 length:249 start_codon:yes stop_codon:yes gene_type:complete
MKKQVKRVQLNKNVSVPEAEYLQLHSYAKKHKVPLSVVLRSALPIGLKSSNLKKDIEKGFKTKKRDAIQLKIDALLEQQKAI